MPSEFAVPGHGSPVGPTSLRWAGGLSHRGFLLAEVEGRSPVKCLAWSSGWRSLPPFLTQRRFQAALSPLVAEYVAWIEKQKFASGLSGRMQTVKTLLTDARQVAGRIKSGIDHWPILRSLRFPTRQSNHGRGGGRSAAC